MTTQVPTPTRREPTPADGGFFTLKAGDLAYLDTLFSGLVPCKVRKVHDDGTIDIVVTATRRAFKRGDWLLHKRAGVDIVNRTQVYTRRGQFWISGRVEPIPDSHLEHA